MELFEQIRREYEFGVGTIAGVSRKLGVHRRMVREALRSAEPAATQAPSSVGFASWSAVSDFIDQILSGRRVQRRRSSGIQLGGSFNGCRRNCRALVPANVPYAAMCSTRREQLGRGVPRGFHCSDLRRGDRKRKSTGTKPGLILSGERVKLQVFEMRSMASGAGFHRAYTHATQQAFLEAHQLAFAYFGGVFAYRCGMTT